MDRRTSVTAEREPSAPCDRDYGTTYWIDSAHAIHREFRSNQMPSGIHHQADNRFQFGLGMDGGDDSALQVNAPDDVCVLCDVKCLGAIKGNRLWIVDRSFCRQPMVADSCDRIAVLYLRKHDP